jgi:hypothetical protein
VRADVLLPGEAQTVGGLPVTTLARTAFDLGRRLEVVSRIDMGWPEYLVGVDFEGAHHWTDPKQRNRDVERYAILRELGWIDVRLTSGIYHNSPDVFLGRVGAALIARGCPKTW